MFFAFTYPYTYTDLQRSLDNLEALHDQHSTDKDSLEEDKIYFHREVVTHSLEGRHLDVVTISSRHGVLASREPMAAGLERESGHHRPHQFLDKKTVFLSARVHPGETASSFVIDGFIRYS